MKLSRKASLNKKYLVRWPKGPADGCRVRCNHRGGSPRRACDARKTLAQPLSHYLRPPRCPVCGSRDWRVDKYRSVVEVGYFRPKPCDCGMYPFPHHKGRGRCQHNPKLTEEVLGASRAASLSRRQR